MLLIDNIFNAESTHKLVGNVICSLQIFYSVFGNLGSGLVHSTRSQNAQSKNRVSTYFWSYLTMKLQGTYRYINQFLSKKISLAKYFTRTLGQQKQLKSENKKTTNKGLWCVPILLWLGGNSRPVWEHNEIPIMTLKYWLTKLNWNNSVHSKYIYFLIYFLLNPGYFSSKHPGLLIFFSHFLYNYVFAWL